jgi:hypothetical protein
MVAATTQFCILSSETWFAIMAVDLFFSLQNPFVSYRGLYPKYHIVCWGIGLLSAFFLLGDDAAGVASADICWVKYPEASNSTTLTDSGDTWRRNKNAFVYLYGWIFVYYLMSILVFFVAIQRINSGLKSTYQSRKCVRERDVAKTRCCASANKVLLLRERKRGASAARAQQGIAAKRVQTRCCEASATRVLLKLSQTRCCCALLLLQLLSSRRWACATNV